VKYAPEPLTTDECLKLLNACSPHCPSGLRNRALIIVLWRGGLRIKEALSLHARDIDNGVIRIRNGKGGKARTVAIDDQAQAHLSTWLECRKRLNIQGNVFCTLKGKSLISAYCRNLFKRLGRKAGIAKRVHPHGLRHTFASGLADEKIDIRVIQKALGHSSLQTTARYIDHLAPHAVIDALKSRSW
jgi:site-specific recombinase XerD